MVLNNILSQSLCQAKLAIDIQYGVPLETVLGLTLTLRIQGDITDDRILMFNASSWTEITESATNDTQTRNHQ